MRRHFDELEASGPHRIVAESEGSSGDPYIDFGCGSCSCRAYLAILFRCYSDRLHAGASRCDVAVPSRCLDLGQAGSALDGVRAVGVAQPMRRDGFIDACRY